LKRLCTDGLIQIKISSLRKLASGLEDSGILVSEDQYLEMKNYGECSWVPASFCKEFGQPIEPPPLSDESDVEFDDGEVEYENEKNKGVVVTEQNQLHQSSNRCIETRPDLQLPSKEGALGLYDENTSKDVCASKSTTSDENITAPGYVVDKVQNGCVENETDRTDTDEGNLCKIEYFF